MYAQVTIKPNTLLRNGAYGIVMRGVQKCTCAGASLRGKNSAPLCCIIYMMATDSVTSIGGYAFCDCDSLTDVYYSGTEAEWNAIRIDFGNGCLTNAEIHYNCIGVPPEPACISVESRGGVAVITNTASEEKTVSAVSAAYDGDGRFTGSKSRRLTLSAGESREIDLSPEDKLFVWNSLGGMQNLLQY